MGVYRARGRRARRGPGADGAHGGQPAKTAAGAQAATRRPAPGYTSAMGTSPPSVPNRSAVVASVSSVAFASGAGRVGSRPLNDATQAGVGWTGDHFELAYRALHIGSGHTGYVLERLDRDGRTVGAPSDLPFASGGYYWSHGARIALTSD